MPRVPSKYRPLSVSVLVSLSVVVVAFLALTGLGPGVSSGSAHVVATPFCTFTGPYTVCSDQADYAPSSTAHLSGSGFASSTVVTIKITRPDSTVVKSNGTPGSDDLTTSAGGSFQYDYVLNGITGKYLVEVLAGAAPGGALLAVHAFFDEGAGTPEACKPDSVSGNLVAENPSKNGGSFGEEKTIVKAKADHVISMICIKTGQRVFQQGDGGGGTDCQNTATGGGGAKFSSHSPCIFTDAQYGSCFVVSGMGTSQVQIERKTSGCPPGSGISHVDFLQEPAQGFITVLHKADDSVVPDGSSVPLGTTMHDEAILTSTVDFKASEGQITFTLYDNLTCNGNVVNTQQVDVPGGPGPVSVGTSEKALAPGEYSFKAMYSGDSSHDPQEADCEPFTIKKAKLTIVTVLHKAPHSAVNVKTSVPLGTIMHDQATVTGIVPGFSSNDVDFTFHSTADCSDGGVAAGSVAPNGGGVAHPSDSTAALGVGSYAFKASIAPNDNYITNPSECENFTVDKGNLTINTELHNNLGDTVVPVNGTVPLLTVMHDQATLNGLAPGINPVNPVTFQFHSTGDCSDGGVDGGTSLLHPFASAKTGMLAVGSYAFKASIVPDGNYNTTDSVCENFDVTTTTREKPTLITVVHDANENDITNDKVALGAIVHDHATLTGTAGDFQADGKITFTLYDNGSCNGTALSTQDVAAVGPSALTVNSSDTSALAAGSYSYLATYTGDKNYTGQPADCEPFTVNKKKLEINTQLHNNVGHALVLVNGSMLLGTVMHDQATVKGIETGFAPASVTFTFYENATCTGDGVPAGSAAPDGSGVAHPSAKQGPLGAGSYAFKASIAPNDNYMTNPSDCEKFAVAKGKLTIVTVLHKANESPVTVGTSVQLGTVMHDQATVTGIVPGISSNNVTFTFHSTANCSDGGTAAGSVAPNGGGVAHPSDSTAALGVGFYAFKASIAPNDNYMTNPSECENFTVDKGTLTVKTELHKADESVVAVKDSVPLGTTMHDQATLNGLAPGIAPANSVTFTFHSTADCSDGGVPAGIRAVVNGVAHPSDGQGLLGAGSFAFKASIAPDSNYNTNDSACENFTVSDSNQDLATLTLGVKPCDPKDFPCDPYEMLVKDNVTVSVEMKTFNIPGGQGYDAWETTVCFPRNLLVFKSLDFKGGPQGHQVSLPPAAISADTSCVFLGASVGVGEDSSQDLGNLANLNFTCKEPSKAISVVTVDGTVILGDNDKKESGQKPAKVTIDCRSGVMSARVGGGFFTEAKLDVDKQEIGTSTHVKADEKFKVTVSIDDLRNLEDKDNPEDGGGYTSIAVTVGYDESEANISQGNGEKVATALVPCTNNADDEVVLDQGTTNELTLTCKSDNTAPDSDENQSIGDVFTITFACKGDSSFAITLDDVEILDENKNDVNVFIRAPELNIECIGPANNKDADACDHAAEEDINAISQALAGIDFMDPNVFDYPDAKSITPFVITIGDVLAYVQNFGLNNPGLGPNQTDLGSLSNPPANVHDVSQPNNDGIGADDILRAALLFGFPCI